MASIIQRTFSLSVVATAAFATILSFSAPNAAVAADYGFIDPGDYYYINNWGDNSRVQVVRKLGNGKVKIRDARTGEASVVHARVLLTKSELAQEEVGNAVLGTAIVFCLLTDSCNN